MKKKPISKSTVLEEKLDKIEKLLTLMDQKNINMEKRLALRITAEIIQSREQIERNFEVRLQIGNTELETALKNRLEEMENRVNKRISTVGDLITIAFTQKFENHDRRIKKLEQVQQAV